MKISRACPYILNMHDVFYALLSCIGLAIIFFLFFILLALHFIIKLSDVCSDKRKYVK